MDIDIHTNALRLILEEAQNPQEVQGPQFKDPALMNDTIDHPSENKMAVDCIYFSALLSENIG